MGSALFLLILVVGLALLFDYVNGFHDTANAVATVVSTGVLPARTAVLLAVSFDLQGNYFIQHNEDPKAAVAYPELPAQLAAIAKDHPDEVVTVCADPQSIYDRVVDLMAIVGSSGFSKVTLCP